MSTTRLPPAIEQQYKRLQQLSSQIRVLQTQLSQLELQLRDTDNALKELGNLDEGALVYKNVGMLLFKSEVPKLTEELSDKKETLELRVKTLQKQEERARKKFEELRERLSKQIQTYQEEGRIAG